MSTENPYPTSALERPTAVAVLAKNWALAFLVILFVVFSITGKSAFFSLNNFENVFYQPTIYIFLAAAETFVIITGGIDLSVGFVMGLSSVLTAQIMQTLSSSGAPVGVTLIVGSLAALVACIIPGLVSGVLIARFRIPPFIATLGMWGITNGITLAICQGFPVTGVPNEAVNLGNGYLAYAFHGKGFRMFAWPSGVVDTQARHLIRILPNALVLWILVIAVLWVVLTKTRFGQHTYAVGGNMEAAKRAGINVQRHLIIVYVLSSFLAGLAGVYDVFQTGVGNFTPFNASYELFAIAAVVIGGASLMGGKGSLIGSVVGVIMLGVLENGLSISGIASFYRFIAVGVILVIAVVMDQAFPDLF